MSRYPFVGALIFVAVLATGCRPERAPSRAQLAEQRQEKKADTALTPKVVPEPLVDDADLVASHCGRPESDEILAIYNKLENGPVRRMLYRGRQAVTLDFIPARPVAHETAVPAPFPHPKVPLARLPENSVWRFDEARVSQHEILTSDRLAVYLPCAASALSREE